MHDIAILVDAETHYEKQQQQGEEAAAAAAVAAATSRVQRDGRANSTRNGGANWVEQVAIPPGQPLLLPLRLALPVGRLPQHRLAWRHRPSDGVEQVAIPPGQPLLLPLRLALPVPQKLLLLESPRLRRRGHAVDARADRPKQVPVPPWNSHGLVVLRRRLLRAPAHSRSPNPDRRGPRHRRNFVERAATDVGAAHTDRRVCLFALWRWRRRRR